MLPANADDSVRSWPRNTNPLRVLVTPNKETAMDRDKVVKAVVTQTAVAGMGAAVGAATKHALTPKPYQQVPMAAQVASAMGAAAATGSGVGGTLAAGGAVVAAKAAAVAAVATAAAPFVVGAAVVGGTIWGVVKLIDYLDS
jgi:hypothetical protein